MTVCVKGRWEVGRGRVESQPELFVPAVEQRAQSGCAHNSHLDFKQMI